MTEKEQEAIVEAAYILIDYLVDSDYPSKNRLLDDLNWLVQRT
jgi:hypothetical protein